MKISLDIRPCGNVRDGTLRELPALKSGFVTFGSGRLSDKSSPTIVRLQLPGEGGRSCGTALGPLSPRGRTKGCKDD